MVVADSPLGVRVVSVEAASQAEGADLRADDLIVRVGEAEVRSIDDFAAVSERLKGRAVSARVLVFRNGLPRELTLHLHSYPLLREWGVEFLPEHDLRFAQPAVGRAHWARLGRGFEEAGKSGEALNAYLNGLHQAPTDPELGLRATVLSLEIGAQRLRDGAVPDGLAALRRGLTMLQRLFDYPLSAQQLQAVRDALQRTLTAVADLKTRHTSSRLMKADASARWPSS